MLLLRWPLYKGQLSTFDNQWILNKTFVGNISQVYFWITNASCLCPCQDHNCFKIGFDGLDIRVRRDKYVFFKEKHPKLEHYQPRVSSPLLPKGRHTPQILSTTWGKIRDSTLVKPYSYCSSMKKEINNVLNLIH